MKLLVTICLFLGLSLFMTSRAYAQENAPEPKNKIFEKKEKQRAKERKQAEKELTKHHLSIQSKETRKRMKKQQKRSNRLKKKKTADPFWKKWFRK